MNKLTVGVVVVILALSSRVATAEPPKQDVPDDKIRKITEAMPDKPLAKPGAARKVLVMGKTFGFRHNSIPVINKALEIMGEKTGAFQATVTEDMGFLTADKLAGFDAIILNNTTKLKFDSEESKTALLDFVKCGKGLVGIHAATDNFYDWPEAAEVMGGVFAGHPWGAGGTWSFKIEEPDHPIVKMFEGKPFKLKEEIYQFKDPYSRERLRVLITLNMDDPDTGARKGRRADKDNGCAWIREYGNGRVFYSTFGHNHDVVWNPLILQHWLAGIQFAIGDLQADAKPVKK